MTSVIGPEQVNFLARRREGLGSDLRPEASSRVGPFSGGTRRLGEREGEGPRYRRPSRLALVGLK